MSADPTTLPQTTHNPSLKSWKSNWNNSIMTSITSPDQLETQSMNSECVNRDKTCECIKRLLFILHFYSVWINANSNVNNAEHSNNSHTYKSLSLSQFITSLKHYSNIHLTNDWLHLRTHHWTDINTQYNTRKLFESVIGKCDELEQCSVFARVNRDRTHSQNNEIRKRLYFINNHNSEADSDSYNESTEVTAQQLCDSIHDCIFHAPIIFLPQISHQTMDESKDSANNEYKYDNSYGNVLFDDDIDEEDWDNDASEVSMLRLLAPTLKLSGTKGFSVRKAAMANIKNTNSQYFQHSKFVTSIPEMEVMEPMAQDKFEIIHKFNAPLTDNETENELKSDKKEFIPNTPPLLSKNMSVNMTNSMGCYEFGIEMMYSPHFHTHARYSTMKDEVLKNGKKKFCISMNQWTDTIKKAQQWMQCINGKSLRATASLAAISIGDALNVSSIVSCLMYTNFTDLQRKFSASTRRYTWQQNETDDDIRIKHYRDYYHWGQTLMIAIHCYGQSMSEKLAFYHGINTELLFGEFTTYFNCPTSTTISLSIASSFASQKGIILKLSGRANVTTKTKFMDVSWFSDFPNEEERLFYGQHNVLEIRSIYRGNRDYKKFIRALKVLDMLTDPPGNGGRRYYITKANESKYFDHLLSMIKNFIEKDKYKSEIETQKNDTNLKRKHWKTKEIPSDYMQSIFNHFCRLQTTISIDCNLFSALLTEKSRKHDLGKYFLVKRRGVYEQFIYCFNIPVLIRLFPKARFIILDFGKKSLTLEQFEYSCMQVSQFLKCLSKNEKNQEKKMCIETVTLSGLLNGLYKYVSKKDITEMRRKYFANTRCKVECSHKSTQFTLFARKKTIKYEHIFVGNLHQIENVQKSSTNIMRNKVKNKRRKKAMKLKEPKKKEIKHVWQLFVSISKEKLVKPKTIKRVIYTLDRKNKYCVNKSPFVLKKNGNKTFKVGVSVEFKGKRKKLQIEHVLDFDHSVTITDVVFDKSKKKHRKAVNDVFHSANYHAFDYYNIHNNF